MYSGCTAIDWGQYGYRNRIVIDPAICHGKPKIRDTPVAVTVIVGSLAGGMTFDEIQREHDVTADDVCAALKCR